MGGTHRLVALASYASGLRLPDTYALEEGKKHCSVSPLMTALCNEVEIM